MSVHHRAMSYEKHGKSMTAEYRAWADMRTRCNNPTNPSFHRYGGRGIKVCARWRSFTAFLSDMGERPSTGHSLDRFPNNNGDYEPSNCRWATRHEQMANTSRNVRISGVIVSNIARQLGVTHTCIRRRRHLRLPVFAAKGSFSRGELCHTAKLTDADAVAIRAAWLERGSVVGTGRQLAREYGVSPATITMLVKRKTWRHL